MAPNAHLKTGIVTAWKTAEGILFNAPYCFVNEIC